MAAACAIDRLMALCPASTFSDENDNDQNFSNGDSGSGDSGSGDSGSGDSISSISSGDSISSITPLVLSLPVSTPVFAPVPVTISPSSQADPAPTPPKPATITSLTTSNLVLPGIPLKNAFQAVTKAVGMGMRQFEDSDTAVDYATAQIKMLSIDTLQAFVCHYIMEMEAKRRKRREKWRECPEFRARTMEQRARRKRTRR